MKNNFWKGLAMSAMMIVCASPMWAQDKYCTSYEEYKSDVWHDLPSLSAEQRSADKKAWWGGGDCKFTCGNDSIDEALKKNSFMIVHDSLMFINMHNLRLDNARFGNGFVRAYRFKDGKSVIFQQQRIGNASGKEISTAMMFGVIGGFAAANSLKKYPVCYLLSDSVSERKGKLQVEFLDVKKMEEMLHDHADMLKLFNSVKKKREREHAKNVLDICEQLGWVKQ